MRERGCERARDRPSSRFFFLSFTIITTPRQKKRAQAPRPSLSHTHTFLDLHSRGPLSPMVDPVDLEAAVAAAAASPGSPTSTTAALPPPRGLRPIKTRPAHATPAGVPAAPPAQTPPPPPPISLSALIRLADSGDAALLALGAVGAVASGAALPLFSLAFGDMLDSLGPAATPTTLKAAARRVAALFLALAGGAGVSSFVEVAAFAAGGARLTRRLRLAYLRSALRQEAAFFEAGVVGGAPALLADLDADARAVQVCVGDKLGAALHHGATFAAGMAVALWKGWDMALVLAAVLPALGAAAGGIAVAQARVERRGRLAYREAGTVASEALAHIRTVLAFNAGPAVADAYEAALAAPTRDAASGSALQGLALGTASAAFMAAYAVALYYGWTRVSCGAYTGGTVMSVLFAALMGGVSLGQAAPAAAHFAAARSAGGRLVAVIRRTPAIRAPPPRPKERMTMRASVAAVRGVVGAALVGGGSGVSPRPRPPSPGGGGAGRRRATGWPGRAPPPPPAPRSPASSSRGSSPAAAASPGAPPKQRRRLSLWAPPPPPAPDAAAFSPAGLLALRGVHFSYPARPDVPVLAGLDLSIPAGTSMALVGGSGCGKSTVISLLLRLYDPDAGVVSVDGRDVRALDPDAYRSALGYVPQEPALFSGSVADNIRAGWAGASDDDVEAAARLAGAHAFVSRLPSGYQTRLGSRGGLLSGGQRQRLAAARAIVRNPRILLLDEATSALDAAAEASLTKALAALRAGRTTVTVAHRLSSVVDCDAIAVLEAGCVVEGPAKHADLLAGGGAYARLVAHQVVVAGGGGGGDAGAAGAGPAAVPTQAAWAVAKAGPPPTLLADAPPSPSRGDALAAAVRAHREALGGSAAASPAPNPRVGAVEAAGASKKEAVAAMAPSPPPLQPRSSPTLRLARLSLPDWHAILGGGAASGLLGFQMPALALVLAPMVALFYLPPEEAAPEAKKWAAILAGALGGGALLAAFGQQACLGVAGAHLTRRLRRAMLASALAQEVAWFDTDPGAGADALAASLQSDAAAARGAAADAGAVALQNGVAAVGGLTIAFIAAPRLAAVIVAAAPLLAGAAWVQGAFLAGFSTRDEAGDAAAAEVAGEALAAHRMVAAFGLAGPLSTEYGKRLDGPARRAVVSGQVTGVIFGVSQSIIFAVYALAFWYGGTLIAAGKLSFDDMLRAFFAVVLAAFGAAQAQVSFPALSSGGLGARRVFAVIDRVPGPTGVGASGGEEVVVVDSLAAAMSPRKGKGKKSNSAVPGGSGGGGQGVAAADGRWAGPGSVSFTDVHFAYPARPETPGKERARGDGACALATIFKLTHSRAAHSLHPFPYSPVRLHPVHPGRLLHRLGRPLRRRQNHRLGPAGTVLRPDGRRCVPGRAEHSEHSTDHPTFSFIHSRAGARPLHGDDPVQRPVQRRVRAAERDRCGSPGCPGRGPGDRVCGRQARRVADQGKRWGAGPREGWGCLNNRLHTSSLHHPLTAGLRRGRGRPLGRPAPAPSHRPGRAARRPRPAPG